MDLGLRNKVILISGGASGIGEAITRVCLAEGAFVGVIGRRTQRATEVEGELRLKTDRVRFGFSELAEPAVCEEFVRELVEAFGGLYGLVNCAGVNDALPLRSTSPASFMAGVEMNLIHYYSLAHYALPHLVREQGAIVNIASKVAVVGQGGTSAYAAAKGAQLALTREWAVELLPEGVRVNAIVPAEVMTPAYQTWIDGFADGSARLGRITSRIPLGRRMTTPSEIAASAVFLLSALQSSHTTGECLFIDGGYSHLDRAL